MLTSFIFGSVWAHAQSALIQTDVAAAKAGASNDMARLELQRSCLDRYNAPIGIGIPAEVVTKKLCGTAPECISLIPLDCTSATRPGKKATDAVKDAAAKKTTTTTAQTDSTSGQKPTTIAPTGNSSADVQSCQRQMQSAIRCCNDPSSCVTLDSTASAQAGGMANNCQQMQDAGINNGAGNNAAAQACIAKYISCMNTCSGMFLTYAGQGESQTFQSAVSTCRALSSKVSSLTNQSASSLSAAQAGQNCNQVANASPQAASAAQAAAQQAQQACAANPNSHECASAQAQAQTLAQQAQGQQTAAQVPAAAKGEVGFQGSQANDPKFALPNQTSLSQQAYTGDGPAGKPGEAPTVNTIANNSGGGIPGAGGSGTPASLGSAGAGARAGGGALASGILTDIDQGFRSGGYAAASGGPAGSGDGSGGGGGYGRRGDGGGRLPASQGLDLKKYLPGGSMASARAGGMQAQSLEIHGRFVDIWARISERFQEKCRLGELMGCGR